MHTKLCLGQGLHTAGLALFACVGWLGISTSFAQCPPGGSGADVVVGELTGPSNYTAVGGIEAVTIGTTSCNVGDAELLWISNTNQHPVIGQNLYRLNNGRYEQIGQAWLKHGFTALQQNACGCGCTSSGTGSRLGVGCSDPYSSGLNGDQTGMGPKYQVNANTGFFNWPAANFSNTGNSIYKRLQVAISDLDPALDGGGMYFSEGQYVTPDDVANGNQNNSASYRRIFVSGAGSSWSFSYDNGFPTQRTLCGIRAWQDNDPSVVETDVQIPNEGLVIVAAKATDLGGGQWQYEYAVQNLNSDRSVGSFSVPILSSAIVTNIGFHDVDYHSGEPFDGTDWAGAKVGSAVVWNCPQTFAQNANANALRWGTLYNFRFQANVGPDNTDVTLGLFKPGTPNAVLASTIGPGQEPPDCNNNSIPDDQDISSGFSDDCNSNGIPDECEPDCDNDGIPDDCEADTDNDGVPDDCDNCPMAANPSQADVDNDGIGDACDPDFCEPTVLDDTFETDQGWTVGAVGDTATTGIWTRVDPNGTAAQPEDDHTASGSQCYVTGQGGVGGAVGDNDVDGGATTLISPRLKLCGDATISYWRWYSNDQGSNPNDDTFRVSISNDDGGSWTPVETIGPGGAGTAGGWIFHSFNVSSFVTPTQQVRVRFVAEDAGAGGSIVEAGVDDFHVDAIDFCLPSNDCNNNCIEDSADIAMGNSFDCNNNGVPDECEGGQVSRDYPVTVSPALAIPDGSGAFVSHDFVVGDTGTVTDVNLDVNIAHTWNGDLIVRLTHGGTTVVVIDRPGFTGADFGFDNDGFNITLDDEGTGGPIENVDSGGPAVTSPPSYTPNNPLSAFIGMEKAGTWTISVSDNATQDTGSLVGWALHISNAGGGPEPCETGACCFEDGSCVGNVDIDECELNLGGVYQGNGTSCGRVICKVQLGSCCLPDGSCVEAGNQGDCKAVGGAYQGNGTTCGSTNCPPPTGACCLDDGTCLSDVTLDNCENGAGGTYQGDFSTCGQIVCVPITDCNGNGEDDAIDILSGASQDCNNNGIPDECDIASGFSTDCDGGPIGNVANGTVHWNSLCINCHGVDGSGDFGPNIQNKTRVEIMNKLAPKDGDHPGGQYPEYTQQQYADLEAFLAQNGSRGRPDGIPDECQPLGADCDDDGTSDACELENGTQVDLDYDGIPDDCQLVPCLADLVDSGTFQPPPDGMVDGADLAFLLGEWGPNPGSPADIVDTNTFQPPPDGLVDGADLAFLLGEWGRCD